MTEEGLAEEEARRLFVAESVRSSEEGPAPDRAKQLAAILTEHEAECAKMRLAAQTRRRDNRRR